MIDILYTDSEKKIIIEIVDSFNDEIIDYYFKNCKSLSKLTKLEKEKLLTEKENKFNLTSLAEIEKIINNVNYSTEKFENTVIELLNSNAININQYKDFVNNLPNVHICTLKRIENNDFNFKTSELIVNEFGKNKEYYGYIKCRTINEDEIPIGNKKYYNQYEALYSNETHMFDKYISNNITFLKYICDNKIYEKYDNHRFMIMSNCPQTLDLLNYAFLKLEDQQMLNDYIYNINSITCDKEELNEIVAKNKSRIKALSEDSFNKFLKCCNNQSIKMKLVWIKKK